MVLSFAVKVKLLTFVCVFFCKIMTGTAHTACVWPLWRSWHYYPGLGTSVCTWYVHPHTCTYVALVEGVMNGLALCTCVNWAICYLGILAQCSKLAVILSSETTRKCSGQPFYSKIMVSVIWEKNDGQPTRNGAKYLHFSSWWTKWWTNLPQRNVSQFFE